MSLTIPSLVKRLGTMYSFYSLSMTILPYLYFLSQLNSQRLLPFVPEGIVGHQLRL